MEVRATLKEHPAIAKAAMLAIILTAGVTIYFETRPPGEAMAPPKLAYFTIDDGATYFSDSIRLAPPFTKDGKVVLKAFVFKGSSGKPWVQYLGRYTPSAKTNIEKLAQQKDVDPQQLANALGEGLEVKAPLTGDKGWVGATSSQGGPICEIHRPPGVSDPLEPAYP
jgi:hypothetical protein